MEEKKIDASSWGQKTLVKTEMPTNPALKVAREVGKKATLIQYSHDELLNHVSNRLKQFDVVKDRQSSFFGRLQNKLGGEDTDKVELDGIVLHQLMTLAGQDLPIEVKMGTAYKIKHSAVREMFEKAKNEPVQEEYDRLKGYDWRTN